MSLSNWNLHLVLKQKVGLSLKSEVTKGNEEEKLFDHSVLGGESRGQIDGCSKVGINLYSTSLLSSYKSFPE